MRPEVSISVLPVWYGTSVSGLAICQMLNILSPTEKPLVWSTSRKGQHAKIDFLMWSR